MKILLTGSPGVGKTTLTKKIADELKLNSVHIKGFYTQEIRDERGNRKGFEVIDINDEENRKSLAIADAPPALKGPKVGKYTVTVSDFESVALKTLCDLDQTQVLIIDEIGNFERKFYCGKLYESF